VDTECNWRRSYCCYNHATSCLTLRVAPIWRKQCHPPCMSIEKAANTTLTERNLETTFKVRMFSAWCNTFGNTLAIYQKLSPLLLQVRGHKINNRKMYKFVQFCKNSCTLHKNLTWWIFFNYKAELALQWYIRTVVGVHVDKLWLTSVKK